MAITQPMWRLMVIPVKAGQETFGASMSPDTGSRRRIGLILCGLACLGHRLSL